MEQKHSLLGEVFDKTASVSSKSDNVANISSLQKVCWPTVSLRMLLVGHIQGLLLSPFIHSYFKCSETFRRFGYTCCALVYHTLIRFNRQDFNYGRFTLSHATFGAVLFHTDTAAAHLMGRLRPSDRHSLGPGCALPKFGLQYPSGSHNWAICYNVLAATTMLH